MGVISRCLSPRVEEIFARPWAVNVVCKGFCQANNVYFNSSKTCNARVPIPFTILEDPIKRGWAFEQEITDMELKDRRKDPSH